jgi:cell division protein FtsW (lipid II flippase)/cell division protein FtsI/penicillin-binding protein 2
MRKRNGELASLIAVALLLGVAGWYAAVEQIGQYFRIPSEPGRETVAAGPINLLRCSPGELRSVLAYRLAEPELGRTHKAILDWRNGLSDKQRGGTFLAQLVQPAAGAAGPALLNAEISRFLRPYWVVRDPAEARHNWFLSLGMLLAAFLGAHLIFRFSSFQGSQVLLPLAMLLCGAATILLFTFTDPLRERLLYAPFAVGVVLGCAGLVPVARFVDLRSMENYRYLFVLLGIVLSLLLVFLGRGPAGTDAKINLFGLFQPVEFIKILVVLFLAGYFAGKDVELRRLEAVRWKGFSMPRWRDIVPVVLFLAATLALFFLQRDLGPALILYLVFLGMFVMTSRRVVMGLTGLALLLTAFWAAYRFRLLQTVATRIEMWLSPWDNHRPGGVQLAESLWALASGGFWGTGPGRGDPQYIPAGHTDLILAAAGEALGFPGLAAMLMALGILFGFMAFYAWRARGNYQAYLGFGLALLFGIQTAVIAAGTLGLIPLSGVPIPFMSYGKSAVIAHFIILGLLLNISSSRSDADRTRASIPRAALAVPALVVLILLGVAWRAFQVMSYQADEILCRGSLTPQQDGVRRFTYNRRLLNVAALITRGSIVDRIGVPLATSRPEDLEKAKSALGNLGIDVPERLVGKRFYPLGPYTVQVLGHTGGYWVDPKTVERTEDLRLRGYPGANEVALVDGKKIVRQDLSALTPAFRDRFLVQGGRLNELVSRDKDVSLTLDARMQVAAVRAIERNLPKVNGVARTKAAAVVLDASTGRILACASLPAYDPNIISEMDLERIYGSDTKAAYDRARFEIYPPGSTFKVVAAAAALDEGWPERAESGGTVVCRHVNYIPWQYEGQVHRRRVTDDEAESAHGRIGLQRALVESCNVYFAWLGTQLGPERLFEYARNRFLLELKGVGSAQDLAPNLPDNAYGQAKISVSPLRMAALAAVIANGGYRVEPTLFPVRGAQPGSGTRVVKKDTASTLQTWMQQVVKSGTGRRAAVQNWIVGGKTGTAQNDIGDRNSHSWFIGFAHPGASGPDNAIAFAFLIENGGYGGRAAAQAAHDFLAACDPTGNASNSGGIR